MKPKRADDKYWNGTRNFNHIQYENDLEDYVTDLEIQIIPWIKVSEETLPKPETTKNENGVITQTVNAELLVYDGESIWDDTYSFDLESDRDWMLKNITHYVEIKNLPKP